MKPDRFNIRVYGIWIKEHQLLVTEEPIRGITLVKLPGGGLEFGEGTEDCLIREWKEELDLDIRVLSHFYTNGFFQPSAFDNSQVISMYYRVEPLDPGAEFRNLEANERSYWMPLKGLSEKDFTLPIDKVVGNMIGRLPEARNEI